MSDSFGDGWNGNTYTITDTSTGIVVASGDLDTATNGDGSSVGSENICLSDGCYTFVVDGGTYQSEISWILTGIQGGSLAGGAPVTETFCIGSDIWGCTDPSACNYDFLATVDDGSCCTGGCVVIDMFDAFGDGWNGAGYQISDENGVAIIQIGDAEGKNGEYDNNYVWIFKFKDGLIHSLREYNSDILVAERLYDYKLIPLD